VVRDERWAAFEAALKAHDAPTPRELEEALLKAGLPGGSDGVSNSLISLWRAGRKRPPFAWLPAISHALVKDPTWLARQMGMVPAESEQLAGVVALANRKAMLEAEIRQLQQLSDSLLDDQLARLVAEVSRSGEYAVAVWPHRTGPPDCRIHAADRLTLRRTDGRPVPELVDVWRTFPLVLDRAGAVVSSVTPRWPSADGERALVSQWSVPRFTARVAARRPAAYLRVRHVCVIAQTVNAWGADTAAAIATFLGYGLDSSRDLVREAYGGERRGAPALQQRVHVHRTYMGSPRERYAWYHHGFDADPGSLLPPVAEPWPPGLVVVVLEESDALLHWRVRNERVAEPGSFAQLSEGRGAMQAAVARHLAVGDERTDYLHVLPVPLPGDVVGSAPQGDSMMAAAVDRAASVLERLLERGLLDSGEVAHQLARLAQVQVDEPVDPVTLYNRRVLHEWARRNRRLTHRS
jgi:hypothetical protein